MNMRTLPLRNLARRPGRTAALLLLTAFLAAAVFGGSTVVQSLSNGLGSLEARLGADVIVVPGTARSKIDLKKTLLQDALGEYYMPRSYMEKIAEVDGVERMTAQTYLASMTTGCCDVSIQIIGFEPETDFIVTPWLQQSYGGALKEGDIVVGDSVSLQVGDVIRFFDQPCTVVARLGRTGTSMDAGAYTTTETIQSLLAAAREKKADLMNAGDPADIVSAVYVKVADGYDPANVAGRVNMHVRHVRAEGARSLLSGVSDSLAGVAHTVRLLVFVLWALAFVILMVAFAMMIGERRREFAVLRVVGASRGMLARMLLAESLILSLAGGLAGVALAALAVFPFSNLIGQRLALPFLLPGPGRALLLAAATLAATILVSSIASAWAAFRLSRVDTGKILREEH